jgi:hypothetical protein
VKGLLTKGILNVERTLAAEGDYAANVYSLHFKEGSGVVLQENHRSSFREPPVVLQKNLQETVIQDTDLSILREATPQRRATDEDGSGPATYSSVSRMPRRGPSAGFVALGPLLQQRIPAPSSGEEEREVISSYIQDVARELGDTATLKASTTRAHNLLRRSQMPLSRFLSTLHEALAITRDREQSRTPSTPLSAVRVPKRRMAYYFAVVEDLMGFRQPPPQ